MHTYKNTLNLLTYTHPSGDITSSHLVIDSVENHKQRHDLHKLCKLLRLRHLVRFSQRLDPASLQTTPTIVFLPAVIVMISSCSCLSPAKCPGDHLNRSTNGYATIELLPAHHKDGKRQWNGHAWQQNAPVLVQMFLEVGHNRECDQLGKKKSKYKLLNERRCRVDSQLSALVDAKWH